MSILVLQYGLSNQQSISFLSQVVITLTHTKSKSKFDLSFVPLFNFFA